MSYTIRFPTLTPTPSRVTRHAVYQVTPLDKRWLFLSFYFTILYNLNADQKYSLKEFTQTKSVGVIMYGIIMMYIPTKYYYTQKHV